MLSRAEDTGGEEEDAGWIVVVEEWACCVICGAGVEDSSSESSSQDMVSVGLSRAAPIRTEICQFIVRSILVVIICARTTGVRVDRYL